MAKLNFEEYRQPWETGSHWELKREFMEKYQNDFPEDRLLCLAQAYSNIELLHCSYPDPVMLQIHELSKPLQGCTRFREVKKKISNDQPELQARPPGKRSAPEDLKKPFKFIKFCPVGSSQATNGSDTGDNISLDTTKPNSFSEDKAAFSLVTPSSSITVPSSLNSRPTLKLPECSTECKLHILTLSQSPDLKLITEIAAGINCLQVKPKDPVEELECVVELLSLQSLVHYKFKNNTLKNKTVILCEFYIGNTLISTGRSTSVRNSRTLTALYADSRSLAALYALEILKNVPNLPLKTLNDLNSDTDKITICFLRRFLQEVTKFGRRKQPSYSQIVIAAASLKSPSDVTCFTKEDCSLTSCIYYSDLVINKILICSARHFSKSRARIAAARQVISVLDKFFKELSKNSESKGLDKSSTLCSFEDPIPSASSKTVTKLTTDSSSSDMDKSKESDSLSKSLIDNNNSLPVRKDMNLDQPSVEDPKNNIVSSRFVNPGYITINYKLLNNSLKKKFVILDNSTDQNRTPRKILSDSVSYCKKSLSYEIYDCDSIPGGPLFRCSLIFDGENAGFGAGFTKAEAKCIATEAALGTLEKQFYTIKVKSEVDESFVINRDKMMNTNVDSDAVSDNNVGYRMLKMMGWTGGGIGKTGGITEPIMASEQRFQQGLGFEDSNGDNKILKKNIESLLREFSQTDTTSDLAFSTDFTKSERSIIHRIASKFGLIGNSKGREDKRRLFVKHKLPVTQLLNRLVKAGGCTPKYELVDKST